MSCGSGGDVKHESVRIRGIESPDAYIFGVGNVNFQRVWRQLVYTRSARARGKDKHLCRHLEFVKGCASPFRIFKVDLYELVFAKKRVVDQVQLDLTWWG